MRMLDATSPVLTDLPNTSLSGSLVSDSEMVRVKFYGGKGKVLRWCG